MTGPTSAPDRGDLVWLNFDPQAGHEQAGQRPALALSPKDYNSKVGLALICPITAHAKGYPFEVRLPADLKIQGVVLSDQIKSMDWRARRCRHAGKVPERLIDEVLAKLGVLLTRHRT